jgi:hypothetical protein
MERKLLRIISLIIVTISLSGCLSLQGSPRRQPKVLNGFLNLSHWDFQREGPVKLDGTWEFYWGQLLTPVDFKQGKGFKTGFIKIPGNWKDHLYNQKLPVDGYATFRLIVQPGGKDEIEGIHIKFIATSYKLWVTMNCYFQTGWSVKINKLQRRSFCRKQHFSKRVTNRINWWFKHPILDLAVVEWSAVSF